MNTLLRSVSVLTLTAAALAAHADVRYDFYENTQMSSLTFSLVTPDLLTSAATFAPGDGHLLSSNYSLGTQVNSITIVPNGLSLGGSSYDLVRFTYTLYNGSTGSDTYPFYSPNAFGTYGTHTFQAGVLSGTLAVSPTPEPSALAALGLGAVALVKRRRRA